MKRTIFPKDFAPYYPIGIQPCPMYVDVANRIYDRLQDIELELPYADDLKREIAVNVAIYYEDKMSGIGLWNAFVAMHRRMYSRSLPFIDKEISLSKEDVNWDEVSLLVWIVLSRNFADRFLNPIAMGQEPTDVIIEVLDEYDEVEVNEDLYDFIYDKDKANDYFKLKHVLIWLRRSYLLCSPLSEDRFEEYSYGYSRQFKGGEAAYYAETSFLMNLEIGPLAELPHLWLAEMYAGNGMLEESDKLRCLRYCQQDIFEVVDVALGFATLKDSKDEVYRITAVYPDVIRKGSFICTALVKYAGNEWEMNGVVFGSNKKGYDKMHDHKEQLAVSYEHAYPLYMERTNNRRLMFFENNDQLKIWLKAISPELDMTEVCHRLPYGPQVAFISKKAGMIFAPGIIHAIRCKGNPYYAKCDARTMQAETMNSVINFEATHPELLGYLLENNMLQDGDLSSMYPSELGKAIFTSNIDFIARNHRRHHYHDHDV